MRHALSIYKLSLPFIEYRYEEAIFNEIYRDFKMLMKYEGIYLRAVEKVSGDEGYILKTIYFQGGKCEFLFQTGDVYYIPKYQLELFFEDQDNIRLVKKIVNILKSYNLRNYIFDSSDELNKYLQDKNIISQKKLELDFRSFGVNELEDFLKNTQKKYLSETLKNNIKMRNSFYYMMFSCYKYYQSNAFTEKELGNIRVLQEKTSNEEYKGILELSSKRLEHIHNITLTNFKKYRKILETFFELFEK